eukprot:3399604-Rhodomonas_salina.1
MWQYPLAFRQRVPVPGYPVPGVGYPRGPSQTPASLLPGPGPQPAAQIRNHGEKGGPLTCVGA